MNLVELKQEIELLKQEIKLLYRRKSCDIYDYVGVQVFVGDIIRLDYYANERYTLRFYLVESEPKLMELLSERDAYLRRILVVGNRYENPELLEELKC